MDRTQSLGLSLLLATVVSGAWAEDSLTRTDVIAETHAAQLAGNIPHGDLDITAAKGPDVHPAMGSNSIATRAQVKAELAQAIVAGDMTIGDEGRTLAEITPARYPAAAPAAVGKTRAEVRAELLEAIRVGDIQQGEEGLTLAQLNPQRYAMVRAQDTAMQHVASK
jgi:hypothetical protein